MSSEDRLKLAKEGLEQAKMLVGQIPRDDRSFLETMARSDSLVDHPDAMEESGTCGHCGMQILMAQVARDLLEAGEVEDGMMKWSELTRKRWEEAKYYQFFQAEKAAGRDPHASAKERGWEL